MEQRVRTLKSVFMVTSGPFRSQLSRQLFRILKAGWTRSALDRDAKRPVPRPPRKLGLELFSGDGQFFLRSRCRSVAWRRGPPGSQLHWTSNASPFRPGGLGKVEKGTRPTPCFPAPSTMSARSVVAASVIRALKFARQIPLNFRSTSSIVPNDHLVNTTTHPPPTSTLSPPPN